MEERTELCKGHQKGLVLSYINQISLLCHELNVNAKGLFIAV